MAGGIEGERPQELTVSQTNQSEQAQNQPESSEGQPLLSVWDVLGHKVRIHEERSSKRMTSEEYDRERREMNRSLDELYEKGTARDRLIQDLHTAITSEPSGTFPNPVRSRELSLQEFQQFRSNIELLSEEELAEEIRKAEEEFKRKRKAKGRYYPHDSAGTF